MNDIIVIKLKKYLFYISCFLFFGLGIHLVFLYLYEGSQNEAQAGGSVSEAIIGTFPHLNPLVPSNDHNAYINGLLYRSLLQYDPNSGNLISDLASCNIENLLVIECVLESNIRWSDDTPITPEDISATLSLIRETKVNPILASLLENTEISTSENSIRFRNVSQDINFLQVFLQPIIPQKVVETLTSETVDGKFSEIGGIYSGRFILTSISQDETVGITRITLGKNDGYFGNTMYIQFLILNLFRDEEHFLKNKNSFNIFNDKNGIIGENIPRLDIFEYNLSQFVGSFYNTEKLSQEMRKFLIQHISREKLIKEVGEDNVFSAINPFLSETEIDTTQSSLSIESYMQKQGFYTKKELLKSILTQETQKLAEQQISAEVISIPEKEIIQQSSLNYIVSPTKEKYNFVSQDNILIEGKVDVGVDAVYINDYKLSGFTAGERVFYYRLIESYDSIKVGENIYTIYFETAGKKEKKEDFIYIYEPDTEKLETLKKDLFTPETSAQVTQTSPTSEVIPQKPTIQTSLSTDAIEGLDDSLFYDVKGNSFSLQLVYTLGDTGIEKSAYSIQKQLKEQGIEVLLIPSTLADITVKLRNESLDYDIILLGVNLGYFGSNIFPYFHSSQVKNGYNFANFKKLSLDILLEELTGNKLTSTKQTELEEKMLDIFQEESIIQVFYTPKIKLLVDKNIKNFTLPQYLPDGKHRYLPLTSAYLSEKKTIVLEDKGVFHFFLYLIKVMFS